MLSGGKQLCGDRRPAVEAACVQMLFSTRGNPHEMGRTLQESPTALYWVSVCLSFCLFVSCKIKYREETAAS